MREAHVHRLIALAAVALLLAPTADALTAAARGVKARPSDAYSPDTAWDLGVHGCGVTIAVFDAGVDDEHPFLKGKVVAGYDATITREMWTLANGGNPQPLVGTHGTPVAGLALSHAGKPFSKPEDAPAYEEDDLVGIAPCAWLVDVMFSDVANDDGFERDVLEAFEWAIAHKDDDWGDDDPSNDGIDVITMSWSPNDETDGRHPICRAAQRAVESGIVVLGSAGNSGSEEKPDLGCPTGANGVISVANLWNQGTTTRDDDALHGSSTWGPRASDGDGDPYEELKPDVAAPGHRVVSIAPSLLDGREYGVACIRQGDLPQPPPALACDAPFGGTSAATPVTAGVVALVLDANPTLSPAEVREILRQTAQVHPDMEPAAANLSAKWDHRYGYGMVDAHAAVRMALTWPGMELGRDLDGDGVRDHLDAAPRDPRVSTLAPPPPSEGDAVPSATTDADGDLVVDAEDADPRDPSVAEGTTFAGGFEQGGDDVPGPGAALAALGLALALAARRRIRTR